MKKVKFGTVMNYVADIKMNSNKKVVSAHYDSIYVEQNDEDRVENIRSFSLTKKHRTKLDKLRKKYKISRSAILRILLDGVEV